VSVRAQVSSRTSSIAEAERFWASSSYVELHITRIMLSAQ